MKASDQIPFYAADGRSLGFRALEAAERLVAGGYVKASYGRKKKLRRSGYARKTAATRSRRTRKRARDTASFKSSALGSSAGGFVG